MTDNKQQDCVAPLIGNIASTALIEPTVKASESAGVAASANTTTTPPAATANGQAESGAELIDIEHFAKVQLRVGQVVAAERVEKSKKLLKLQVDLGSELGTRQILSGISQFYTPEQMLGRKIVVVANLKPATMMGLESRGMLLAASSADRTSLSLINPGEDATVGSLVS